MVPWQGPALPDSGPTVRFRAYGLPYRRVTAWRACPGATRVGGRLAPTTEATQAQRPRQRTPTTPTHLHHPHPRRGRPRRQARPRPQRVLPTVPGRRRRATEGRGAAASPGGQIECWFASRV